MNIQDRIALAKLKAAKSEMERIASEGKMTDWEVFEYDQAMSEIETQIVELEVKNNIRCDICGETFLFHPIESESELREGSNERGSISCGCGTSKVYDDFDFRD